MKEIQDYRLASLIQKAYIDRCEHEKEKVRVSNLIYSFPSKREPSSLDFNAYLRTYWHDTLKDCVCQVFLKEGLIPYKEEFLLNNGIKGHDDITLYRVNIIDNGQNWELLIDSIVECKNYLKTRIVSYDYDNFRKQALYYCALKKCNIFYMVINNSNIIVVNKYEITDEDIETAILQMKNEINASKIVAKPKESNII